MKLLVLDGNSILNRAFYGIKLLTTKSGEFTNAVYGFMTTFNHLLEENNPDAVAVAFDLKAPTFRHKAYSGYKAQRKGMPPELASQLEPLKELLSALGYKTVTCEGFEADDILGTLANVCTQAGNSCIIATGDRDSLQLVSPAVSVRITATKAGKPDVTVYDEAKILEDKLVTPKQLIDVKAIQGDTSDNIPGVKGIGEKGATDLISRFHDLDYIYENIDTIDIKPAVRKKLIDGRESAYLSRMLGTIRTDAPIDTDISSYIPKPRNNSEVLKIMTRLEFFSLIQKMNISADNMAKTCGDKTDNAEKTVRVEDSPEIGSLYNSLKNKTVDFIAETDGESIVSLSIFDGETIYYNINGFIEGFNKFIESFFSDETILKRTHNSKPIFYALEGLEIEISSLVSDTMLAGYLLNPNSSDYSLERLSSEYGTAALKTDKAVDSKITLLPKLSDSLTEQTKSKGLYKLLEDIEIPLSRVLASMERQGVEVDKQGIIEYGNALQNEINLLQQSIYEHIGYEFNINSPKQLGKALFEDLGLPAKKKTKTGYSTNVDVLEELRDYHPVINEILEYRTAAKLKSTYCDGLVKVISPDGRIHSSFNQTETRTGRISSAEPNLQNIPVRTERGREFRKFFRAKDKCLLVDADYSQIELRVLAHIANDKNMIDAFKNNVDIHTSTASQVFNIPIEMITPELRSRAKAVNFGIVYGIGAFSLSKDIGVSIKEADRYIKGYLSLYSGIDEYMKKTVEDAKENGYVTTMFGRRRYLPELTASNHAVRAFGERVAKNMPIQGTAADIIKIAMIRVFDRLKKENMKSKLILQIHDELIVEAPEDEAEKAAKLLNEEMENAVKLSVELTADSSFGKTWYDAKS